MFSRWNAGSMIMRERRWKSPSIVSRPSPISPIRSRKWPSRQAEVGGVRDEHVVVGRRPEHEHDVAVEQAQREHRAVALVGLEQHLQRFVGKAPRARHREARLPGGKGAGRALVAQVLQHHRERVAVEHRGGPTSATRKPIARTGQTASFAAGRIARGCRGRPGVPSDLESGGRSPMSAEPWHTERARQVPLACSVIAGA